MFICFLSLFVIFKVSDAYVNVLSIIVFFSLNFSVCTAVTIFYKPFCRFMTGWKKMHLTLVLVSKECLIPGNTAY